MIKKAISYFVLITALLYGFRSLHYYGLLKQDKGYYGKYNTAFLQKNNYDLLFLGSSRAEMHYNTRVFDSITGKNSFNLSLAGATPRLALAALKAYLVNSEDPKEIIYETDYHFLKFETKEIKDFNNYFPYFQNTVLLEEFNKIDPRMRQFLYNPFYSLPYSGLKNLSTSLHGWFNIPNKTDEFYYKGFLNEEIRPRLNYIETRPYSTFIHLKERQYLDSLLLFCKERSIQLTMISSPIFAGGKVDLLNKNQIMQSLHNYAGLRGVRYKDLSSMPFCNRRSLFVDHFHMNGEGARIFTLHFALQYRNKFR